MTTKEGFPETMRVDQEIAFKDGLQSAVNEDYRKLIEMVPTTSSAKKEVFYGDKGRLQRLRGERQPKTFFEYHQLITLDTWEMTETVSRDVLDDDQSGGILKKKVGEFGGAVSTSLQMETEEFLRNGVSITCFDTHSFFYPFHTYVDSSGVDHGVTQSNINWGGSKLVASTVQAMSQHFAQLKSDTNKVMGGKLTDVGVRRGTINDKSARELSNSSFTVEISTTKGANTKNVFEGIYNIMRFDYGLDDEEWFAFDLSRSGSKPIKVLSHSVSPGFDNLEFTQLLTDSETGFWRNEFAFGVQGRFDWNPGDWRTAYLNGSSAYSFSVTDYERQRVNYPNA